MNDIKIYKLTSGEEVLATEVRNDVNVEIKDPILLMYQPVDNEGTMTVGFAPFMPNSEGNIILERSGISAIAAPKDGLIKEYTRVTSGLIIADASSLPK